MLSLLGSGVVFAQSSIEINPPPNAKTAHSKKKNGGNDVADAAGVSRDFYVKLRGGF